MGGFKLEQTINTNLPKANKQDAFTKLMQKEVTLYGSFFNNKKKEHFYTELSVLLKAGIHLREALQLMSEMQKKEKLRDFFLAIVEDLDSGQSFSEILMARKDFTEYEYYSVQIGEESGNLIKILEELGLFFTKKNEQRRSLINAMTYPIIILSTAVLVVVFMLRMVVPMFEDIFRQNNVELPAITLWIIAVSNFIESYGLTVLLLFGSLIALRKVIFKNPKIQRWKDYFLLRIPYVGQFIRSVYLAQFTQAVALLTSSKVPMLNSLQMVKRMIIFHPLQDALAEMEKSIMQGSSLHESIKGHKIFDHKMASLVKVAEETNQTEYIFERLNKQYALEVEQKSKLLSTIMEPLIIIIIGLFVGIILVSMYLPMFKLSSVLGG